jgi:2-polyprenyl-3-methyl-5-hydroxy-6-metoxy-1,4-benzoquinol methylase
MAFLSALARRDRIPELMDDPGLDPALHREALAGLARLNRFSGSVGVLWPAIRAAASSASRPLRVLDVATGSGDVPFGLWKRATAAGLSLELHACDISEIALADARRTESPIRFFWHDAIHDPLPAGFDVVTCSLFLHHLSEEDAVTLLERMAAAGRMVLVNDLARSRLNYVAVWIATRVLSRSTVVRFDGPASVRSAFSPREALALAERAGLRNANVGRRFPCRYLLEWSR